MQSDLVQMWRATAPLAGLWCASAVGADTLSASSIEDPIQFQLAVDVLPAAETMLSNGVAVRPSDWQTVILANLPAGDQVGLFRARAK